MKILKPGNMKKMKGVRKFKCYCCDCEFEADNTEYRVDSQYTETLYFIDCPCCNNLVYVSVDTE